MPTATPGNVGGSDSRFLHRTPASWRCPTTIGGDDVADGDKVHSPGMDGTGRVKADKGRAGGRKRGKKAGGGGVVPPRAK